MPIKKKPRAPEPGAARRRKGRAARAALPKPPPAERDKATIRRLKRELAQAVKQIEELQASAETDFLLGIFNRRGFERALERAIAYIKRYHASGALIVLDVDRLKPINDLFGHAAGDQVLKAIIAALAHQVRASDVIGRNLSETDARAKAASLEQAIDQLSFVFGGRTVTAGASAGIAILDSHAEAGKALEQADRAMYLRKAQRRHEESTAAAADQWGARTRAR